MDPGLADRLAKRAGAGANTANGGRRKAIVF
jgi:hypothetical protein